MTRTPDQEAQEELLKAMIENDYEALAGLTEKYGPADSEKLAYGLHDVRTYIDPETPQRIAKIFAKKKQRLQMINKTLEMQELNATEDGTNHGPMAKNR